MRKILVEIKDNYLVFSPWLKKTNPKELNNTNIIDIDSIKLSEDYIAENLELVSQFIKLLCIKEEITKSIITNYEITGLVIMLLNKIDVIKELKYIEDIELNYTITKMILSNKTLEKIECYSMPDILFKQFAPNRVETREEILFLSSFMINNKITTLSKLANKDKIEIDSKLTEQELDEMKFFFQENKSLEKIIVNNYNRKGLIEILDLLKDNHTNRIQIIINEDKNTTKHILGDIEFFKKLNEIYFVKIKVKYSKEYIRKNRPREFFIKIMRNVLIIIILASLIFLYNYKMHHKGDRINVQESLEEINEIVDDTQYYENLKMNEDDVVEEIYYEDEVQSDGTIKKVAKKRYVNPYYKKYAQAYDELLEINDDTIGWLKVNNTKINYPVVQAKDNDYYLNHSYSKKKNNLGWIFADYKNTFTALSDNTIIYGHNAIDLGLMFGTLDKVLTKQWYKNESNLTIMFSIKNNVYYWKIFSIYTIKTTTDYLQTDFYDKNEYQEFIDLLKNRSKIPFDTKVTSNDKILTLSTCHNDNNHRLVVHAVRIE